jgi:hypothetical protein
MVSKDGTDCICVYADINDDNARKLMKFIKVPDIFSDTLYTDKKKRYERFGKRLANKINFDILTDNRWEYNVVVFLRANKKEKYFYGQYSAAFEKDGKKEGREAYEMELDEAEFLTNDFQAIH